MLVKVHEGQCGMCKHFGEHVPADQPKLTQIRISGQAPEDFVEPCGLDINEQVHLSVSVLGGCDRYEAVH